MTRKKSVKRKKTGGRRHGDTRKMRKSLREIHDARSPHAQHIDEVMVAKRAPSPEAWEKQPGRYDVSGVDLPLEWRDDFERKELSSMKRDVKMLEKQIKDDIKAGHPDLARSRRKGAKVMREAIELLEWQKQHPFISAGEGRLEGSGITNYNEAKRRGTKYGFDLRRPQQSFLDALNLKQRDIKSMRIMLYLSKLHFDNTHRHVYSGAGSANAYYIPIEGVMHIPPLTPGVNVDRRNQTIIHEIGHHIYHDSPDLRMAWFGKDKLNVKELHHTKRKRPALAPGPAVEFIKVKKAPWEVAADGQKYFGLSNLIDLSPWRHTYMKTGTAALWERDPTRISEAWAETFVAYRRGDLKKEIAINKILYGSMQEYIQDHQQLIARYKGKKSTSKFQLSQKKLRKKQLKSFEEQAAYYGAKYDNQLTFYNWIKGMDRKGWMMPKERAKVRPVSRKK